MNFSVVLIGILYFVLGIVFIAATDELLKAFNYILVCICAIIGVIQIISFFLSRNSFELHYSDLLIGIIFIWVSLVLYVYYGFMINILPILFSLYLFVMSSSLMRKYVELKKLAVLRCRKYLILSIVAILVGLLLIFNPGSIILIYLKVTGVYLILVAFMYFADFFRKEGQ